MTIKKENSKNHSKVTEQAPLYKFETLKYEDFTSGKEIKTKYFVLINKSIQDKRILSSIEEVKFAGRYVEEPIILGFRTLTEAKSYLAGPRLSTPKKKKSR